MTSSIEHLFSENSEQTLIRLMIYGKPKTRKTLWVGKIAELGFNPIFLDGDNGFHILVNVPEKVRNNRISRIACQDDIKRPVFAPFVINLLKNRKLIWNDTKRENQLGFASMQKDCNYAVIDLNKLTNKDILIVDSWTKMCTSLDLRYAVENNIDLTEAEKWEWDGYAYSGALVDWSLNALSALPCHVIVIGHEHQYEKYSGKGRDRTLVSSTTVMKANSNPKSLTVPSNFSDILYFYIVGGMTKIDTRAESDRIGGCRGIAPGTYNFDQLSFADLCKAYRIPIPGNAERDYDCEAVRYFVAGEEIPEDVIGKKSTPAQIKETVPIAATTSTKATLAGLMGKK